jgi:hypothetical protein
MPNQAEGPQLTIEEAMRTFPPLYVIYRRPRDLGHEIVMRVWFGMRPYTAFGFDEIPGGRPALDRARNVAKNMGAVTCLVRHPTDDPCIVESWL